VCAKIGEIIKEFYHKIPSILTKRHGGAILIEFAVAVPVLAMLLYFTHDLPKYARMQERMTFVAHEIVNILQNISQNRGGDNKRITLNDIRYAMSGAYLSIYPGTTMFSVGAGGPHALAHWPAGFIHCVKGNSTGTAASVIWSVVFYTHTSQSPAAVTCMNATNHSNSIIPSSQNVAPSVIYPGLTISSDQRKIIVECSLLKHNGASYRLVDGTSINAISNRKAFGFWILNPTPVTNDSNGGLTFFNTVVIFTPEFGLFADTPPQ
jgi:hypothetical protein